MAMGHVCSYDGTYVAMRACLATRGRLWLWGMCVAMRGTCVAMGARVWLWGCGYERTFVAMRGSVWL